MLAMKALRVWRYGIPLNIFNLGTRRRWVSSFKPRPVYP